MVINLSKIYNTRREYTFETLRRSHLTKNPIHLFKRWLKEAYLSNKIIDPTAMCLATTDNTGQPFQRLVLLKHFNNKNMIFFTNLSSNKAVQLTSNSKISVCFPWNVIDRQIIITGNVYLLPKEKVYKYFYNRPKNSQISTWASRQSAVVSSRNELENNFLKLKKKYCYKKIPFPNFWGGYTIKIGSIEFWQGRMYRLHDRFLYKKNKSKWHVNRLFP